MIHEVSASKQGERRGHCILFCFKKVYSGVQNLATSLDTLFENHVNWLVIDRLSDATFQPQSRAGVIAWYLAKICTLFAQDRAIGEGAQTAFEALRQMETNEESNNLESSRTIGSHDDATNVLEDQHGRSNASSSSGSRTRKRKPRSSDTLHLALGLMVESLVKILYFEPPKVTRMVLQISKVQGLDQTQLFRTVDLMMHDPKKFETFSDLPDDMKKPYVLMHLNQ